MDTIVPFIHSFTYHAMVNDILHIKDRKKLYVSLIVLFVINCLDFTCACSLAINFRPQWASTRTRQQPCPTQTQYGPKSSTCTWEKLLRSFGMTLINSCKNTLGLREGEYPAR